MKPLYSLTEHVYIFPFVSETDQPNLGYIRGNKKTLLVDSGCGCSSVVALRDDLMRHGLSDVDEMVLTHYHWDHSFGICHFDVKTYASLYTCKKMEEVIELHVQSIDDMISDNMMPEFCREHLRMEYPDVSSLCLKVPEHVVSEALCLDLGGVHVDIFPVVSPHCEGSLLIYVREDHVLFIGDADCGYIQGVEFIDDYERLEAFYDIVKQIDFQYIILGHADVLQKQEYCEMMNERLRHRINLR